MQIEGTSRDRKNHRFGFALRYTRTKRPERIEALLFVASLATLVLWLLGLAATIDNGSGTSRPTPNGINPVLSTVFLGQELWRNHWFRVTFLELVEALKHLKILVIQEGQHA